MSGRRPQLTFRPLQAEDMDLLAGWLREAGLGDGLASDSGRARSLSDPRIVCRLAVGADGDPVGLFRLDLAPDHTAEVTVVVAPDRRRTGLGGRILEASLQEARHRGLRCLVALVATTDGRARAFFRAFGFETTGSSGGYEHMRRIVHSSLGVAPLEITP